MTTVSAKMKRRRRQRQVKRRRTERAENLVFWRRGTIPSSACGAVICSCGARAFTRDPDDLLDDFNEAHAYCDDEGERP